MQVKSLSYSTLLHVLSCTCKIISREEYVVVESPGNPWLHWGNFLLFPSAPQKGDLENWTFLFKKELHHPSLIHTAFAWDSLTGNPCTSSEFTDAGYYFESDEVLTLSEAKTPQRFIPGITCKAIEKDEEWEKIIDLNVQCTGKESGLATREFAGNTMQMYRSMTERGNGVWMGAFSGGSAVADMGLFDAGKGRGLIVMVKTHPDFRRKGICTALLSLTAHYGIKTLGFKLLVVVADRQGNAGKIYKSSGFRVAEYGASLLHPRGSLVK